MPGNTDKSVPHKTGRCGTGPACVIQLTSLSSELRLTIVEVCRWRPKVFFGSGRDRDRSLLFDVQAANVGEH